MMEWIAVLLGCFLVTQGEKLPDSIPRCHRHDPYLNQCLVTAIQVALPQLAKGIPELDFLPLDPWNYGDIDFPPTEDNTLGIYLRDAKIHGLSRSIVVDVGADLENSRMDIYVTVPEIHIEANYRFDGKFMNQTLNSSGHCNLTFPHISGIVSPTGNTFRRKGRSYLNVDRCFVLAKSVPTSLLNFDGLDPDPKRNAELNGMFNENSLILFELMKSQWEQQYSVAFRNLTRPIFSKVPLDEIFLETNLLYFYYPRANY